MPGENYKEDEKNPSNSIPKYGFKVKLNHEYPENRNQHFMPSLKIIWTLLPLILRYLWFYTIRKIKRKSIVMDYITLQRAKRIYGVPIGGIGSGSIGRGFRGEFCRFQLRPDVCDYNTVDADQFIITIKDKNSKTIFQSCLSTYQKSSMPSWKSLIDGSKCNYTGLYPRSWTEYDLSEYGVILICRQISPVIPHNYMDSCLPCSVFVWDIKNVSDEDRTVSISFTFKNGTGDKRSDKRSTSSAKGFSNENADGVILYHTIDKNPCSYNLAVKTASNISITKCLSFIPGVDEEEVWNQLYKNGKFNKTVEKTHNPHTFGEMAVGVSAKTTISTAQQQTIEMVLAWDMSMVTYPVSKKKYYRFYTGIFGKENASLKIVNYAFAHYRRWEEDIYAWQKDVLDDKQLPDWYKSALFNETYFVSDGGAVWLTLDEDVSDSLDKNDPRKKYGRFAYLEGHEYRMYNSYDVHFYASHALSKNWPLLQKCLQYDLKDFVATEIPDKVEELSGGKSIERKIRNTVPHDAGDPGENPFILINSYPIHDVSCWRDLNSKFVLQTYRDAVVDGNIDLEYVKDMYKTCHTLMQKSLQQDVDNDGLIENSGVPDQTYDTWVMTGVSAYCGGLWLAAVHVMILMSESLNKHFEIDYYRNILNKAKKSFDSKLWNGEYYNFDCSSNQRTSIMSDQLNGQWYLGCTGTKEGYKYPILPKAKIQSSLRSIYENNVARFCEGKMGAVNGFQNGCIDKITIQSQEVWTGVTYALAATMLQEGMITEAFNTAGGMFKSMTEKCGLIFDTPEAIYEKNHYRSIGYMRPLSIWSMQIAWENYKQNIE